MIGCNHPCQFGFPGSAPTVCRGHSLKGMFQGSPLAPPPSSRSCTRASFLEDEFEFENVQFDDEEEHGSVDSTSCSGTAPKKKRARREWVLAELFSWSDEGLALKLMNTELDGSAFEMVKNQPYDCKEGYVQIFKCNGKKHYGCECQWKLVYNVENSSISAHKSGKHFHEPEAFRENLKGKSAHGIPLHSKKVVTEAVKDRKEPGEIHRKLTALSPETTVTLQQLQTASTNLKRKLLSALDGNTIGDLYRWLDENTLTDMSGEDEVGVLPGWRAHGPENLLDAAADVTFVLSTKNLLNSAVKQASGHLPSFVDVDQTYKVLKNNYPLSVVGTVDINHKFYLIGVGISRFEDGPSISLMLQTIKNALRSLSQFEWKPAFGMADRAGAIANAFQEVFPGTEMFESIKLAKCYFHVKKGLEDNAHRFKSRENFDQFVLDCKAISGFDTEEQFVHALDLLRIKWQSREKDAVVWFFSEWASENYRNWFSGFTTAGIPNTNNSVERFNGALKKYLTRKQRLSLSRLLVACQDELSYQSVLSRKGRFATVPTLDRSAWIDAQIWAKELQGKVLATKYPAEGCFFVPSTSCLASLPNVSLSSIRSAYNDYRSSASPIQGEKFNAFVSRRQAFWKLTPVQRTIFTFGVYSCNCPYYLQYATCKHSLGLGLLHKHFAVPPQWKGNSVEERGKRGRPRKIGHCLTRI